MTLDDNILLYIIILIILFLFIIFFVSHQSYEGNITYYENLTPLSNEAVQDIASLYNKNTLIVSNLDVTQSSNIMPKGVIVAWSGEKVPNGWALCDGTQGSPDLRGRFILGAGQGNNLTIRNLGQSGGEENHLLTINEIPSHQHQTYAGNLNDYTNCWCSCACTGRSGLSSDAERTSTTTGGGQAHNNMPPFYVLSFIMKL